MIWSSCSWGLSLKARQSQGHSVFVTLKTDYGLSSADISFDDTTRYRININNLKGLLGPSVANFNKYDYSVMEEVLSFLT